MTKTMSGGGRFVALITVVSFAAAAGHGMADEPAVTPPPPVDTPTPVVGTGAPIQPSFAEGMQAGEIDAARVGGFGWGAGGFCAGAACGCLGCLAVSGTGLLLDPASHPAAQSRPPDWVLGYDQGYKTKLKHRRATSAFIGGAIGVIIGGIASFVYLNSRATPTPT